MNLQSYLAQQISSINTVPDNNSPTNTLPKMIFVNGLWSSWFPAMPTQGGQGYWFDGASFFTAAGNYFSTYHTVSTFQTRFADGSDTPWSSAADRKSSGWTFAQTYYYYLTSNAGAAKPDIYLVGHSQGCAFAAGIAEYLSAQGHAIKEIVFLSCHQGEDFSVNLLVPLPPIYQLVLGYYSYNVDESRYEHWVDWVVGKGRAGGVTRMGIALSNYNFLTVHGSTNSDNVFKKIADLRSVNVTQTQNNAGQKYYAQSYPTPPPTNYNTKFYSVDDKYISPNHPAWDGQIINE